MSALPPAAPQPGMRPDPAPDADVDGETAARVAADAAAEVETPPDPAPPMRLFYLILGLICVGLGLIGAIVPGLPTTVFMIVAVWAFARSSRKLHDWIAHHPRFGPPVRDWRDRGAISPKAKTFACATMAVSPLFVWLAWRDVWVTGITAAILLCVAAWILTRPSA